MQQTKTNVIFIKLGLTVQRSHNICYIQVMFQAYHYSQALTHCLVALSLNRFLPLYCRIIFFIKTKYAKTHSVIQWSIVLVYMNFINYIQLLR